MRRAALLVVLLALAGCRSSHAHPPPSGAIVLRPLPAQGLVVERRGGVALLDLHGRRLVWLRRFAVYPRSEAVQTSLEDLLGTRLPLRLLHGPRGWYRLDAARHMLVPVRHARVPLVAGATVVAHRGDTFTVERKGHVVLRGGVVGGFSVLSERLVQGRTTLLDVATGRRWKLPRDCIAAGLLEREPIVGCGMGPGKDAALVLERLVAPGVGRRIAQPVAHLVPQTASLSPDRAWVAIEGDTGCASRYTYVAPARGGTARIVYGRSAKDPFTVSAANFSQLLGWSADGRLVVLFTPPYCDEPYGPQHPPKGVYLVDPRTLARTFVTRSADAMWATRTP
jgi:hypothetical protein